MKIHSDIIYIIVKKIFAEYSKWRGWKNQQTCFISFIFWLCWDLKKNVDFIFLQRLENIKYIFKHKNYYDNG